MSNRSAIPVLVSPNSRKNALTFCPAPNPTLEGGATSDPDNWLPSPNPDFLDHNYPKDDYQFIQTDSRFRPPSDNESF
jgi:hypothetical protein